MTVATPTIPCNFRFLAAPMQTEIIYKQPMLLGLMIPELPIHALQLDMYSQLLSTTASLNLLRSISIHVRPPPVLILVTG
jgi:hypothetical protein